MKLRLESFGELRLIDLAGQPVAFPEKGLLEGLRQAPPGNPQPVPKEDGYD
ncbi:UNVERIFIED_ORG: hypothetical protein M2435_005374 [Rhizobium sophorae]|nr:hypothetical protein [Rhizobium leguminosarum]MDH6662444.1 hypothetical protein [Rhizobium sophorae]